MKRGTPTIGRRVNGRVTGAAAATLAGALALAGCATADGVADAGGATATPVVAGAATEPSSTAIASPAADERPAVPAAFDFTAPTVLGNGTFDGSSIAGTDVILWFWAPWCPTCAAEAPEIDAAMADLPDGVEIIGIAGLSGDTDFMKEFVRTYGVEHMTHIADLDGSIWRGFEVASQATVLFVDDSGESTALGGGLTSADIVREAERLAST